MSSAAPPAYDDDGGPFGGPRQQQQQQQSYSFSGRVLLTAAVVLAVLAVVFVLVRLLLLQFVLRGRGGGVLRRSFTSFGRIGSSSSRRHGLDATALAALPVTAYRKRSGGGGAGTDCAVCLSELADGEKVRALPSCGHVFHVECVDAWLRSRTTCPVCRADVLALLLGAGGTPLVVTVEGGAAGAGAGAGG